jgi:hypothetical protein
MGNAALVPAFVVAGTDMGPFFAPIANVVLSAVRLEGGQGIGRQQRDPRARRRA